MKKISLDTNAFIYFFEDPSVALKLKPIFQQAVNGKVQIIVPTILWTEILCIPFRENHKQLLSLYSSLDQKPFNLKFIEINKKIAVEAARIRAQYSFKTPDSLFLATGLIKQVDIFLTNDQRLHQFKELKIKTLAEL